MVCSFQDWFKRKDLWSQESPSGSTVDSGHGVQLAWFQRFGSANFGVECFDQTLRLRSQMEDAIWKLVQIMNKNKNSKEQEQEQEQEEQEQNKKQETRKIIFL